MRPNGTNPYEIQERFEKSLFGIDSVHIMLATTLA